MTDLRLSEDGFLLAKSLHSGCLKEEIDISKIDFDRKRYITKDEMLEENKTENYETRRPKNKVVETYHIQQLYKYDTPKPNDIVCWYDDIGVLSGSAGYILIRDGYVSNYYALWRS
jgi:hypothetical protein